MSRPITSNESEVLGGDGLECRHYVGLMTSTPPIAEIAALVGNPARANMLTALLDGRALTASELAYAGHVSAQTASGYLAKLTEARLLALEKHGRYSYYRLASPLIGRMLEGIMAVAADGPQSHQPHWKGGEALRTARTCYDHLAGKLAVALADTLVARRQIVLAEDGGQVTTQGIRFLSEFGIDPISVERRRRTFCRPCLDWSERRPHLAGAVGAALATRCFELGWIERLRDSRAVAILPAGQRGFAELFGIETI
jgi:DNA-binding transcriptional ArsR family regulator